MASDSPLTLTNPVFKAFCFYGGLVVTKMLLITPAIIYNRLKKNVFLNKEDFQPGKQLAADETVERLRRIHYNDLENIPAFMLLGLLYVATNPVYTTALWLFRVFTVARFVHTTVYVLQLQPWRFFCHLIGLAVMLCMSYNICSSAF